MPRIWKREIRVEIAGRTISSPDITFTLRRHANERGSGHVEFRNLRPGTVNEIEERRESTPDVQVHAGYDGSTGLLMQGVVRRLSKHRRGVVRLTRVHLGDYLSDTVPRAAVTASTWEGEQWVGSVVGDAVTDDMELQPGALSAIPRGDTLTDFSYSGKTADLLELLLRPRGVDWYVEGETVLFTRRTEADVEGPVITLNERTGLIGSPTLTERDRVRAESFLNPAYQIGRRVRLESEYRTGDFRLAGILHRGGNRSGPFRSELELWNL